MPGVSQRAEQPGFTAPWSSSWFPSPLLCFFMVIIARSAAADHWSPRPRLGGPTQAPNPKSPPRCNACAPALRWRVVSGARLNSFRCWPWNQVPGPDSGSKLLQSQGSYGSAAFLHRVYHTPADRRAQFFSIILNKKALSVPGSLLIPIFGPESASSRKADWFDVIHLPPRDWRCSRRPGDKEVVQSAAVKLGCYPPSCRYRRLFSFMFLSLQPLPQS